MVFAHFEFKLFIWHGMANYSNTLELELLICILGNGICSISELKPHILHCIFATLWTLEPLKHFQCFLQHFGPGTFYSAWYLYAVRHSGAFLPPLVHSFLPSFPPSFLPCLLLPFPLFSCLSSLLPCFLSKAMFLILITLLA